jgi:NADH-quinone oxidoreductase subunit L
VLLTAPLWVLSFCSVFAGYLLAPAFGIELFREWFEPAAGATFPSLVHPDFSLAKAAIAVVVVLAGYAASYLFYWRRAYAQDLAERHPLARAGKTLLVNKYYLDDLYTGVIVGSVKGPVARAVYWVNQHVIDNVLNWSGRGAQALGRATYDRLDQRIVDGAFNGLAVGTGEAGGVASRRLQTGRLQQYALWLVLGVACFAAALWIAN